MFLFDKKLGGFRLKKNKRFTKRRFHSHESELTRIIEKHFGLSNVVTGFHPLWAVSQKGVLLEFDIFIVSKGILIEYNGQQHYKFVRLFHKTKKRFEAQQKRDVLKMHLAEQQHMPLVIIKYDEPLVEDYVLMKIGEANGRRNQDNTEEA